MNCPNCNKAGFTNRGSMATHTRWCSTPLPERFWPKVEKAGPDDCWLWNGCRNSWGYGTFNMSKGKNTNASRAAWIFTKGPIEGAGIDVLHTCNVKLCCNPAHMYLGTDKENSWDRVRAGTQPRGERSWQSKLNDEKVREIRRDYKRFGPRRSNAKELAHRYGVAPITIGAIIYRGAWRHVK